VVNSSLLLLARRKTGLFLVFDMKNGLKHKLIDLVIFGSLFGLLLLAVRSKARKNAAWFGDLLLKTGFVTHKSLSPVRPAQILAQDPNARLFTRSEYEYLKSKGAPVTEANLLEGE